MISHFTIEPGKCLEALLVSLHEQKHLFERHTNGHEGKFFECCLWVFSEPGTMKHTISQRSVNGIPVLGKETLIMQQVK